MNLTHHFLLAMPSLNESYFDKTLTYLYEHSADGAMGFVINRQTSLTMGEVFEQLEIECPHRSTSAIPVFEGGPVSPGQGFLLQTGTADQPDTDGRRHSQTNSGGVQLSGSLELLQPIAQGRGPERFLMLLGYAGWAAGQLEAEITDNAWLTAPADIDIIFEPRIEERFNLAARSLGIDFSRMSSDTGHA